MEFSKEQIDAAKRLRVALVFVEAAVIEAQMRAGPNATTKMATVTLNKDGSGQVGGKWEYESFVKDIETLCEVVDPILKR